MAKKYITSLKIANLLYIYIYCQRKTRLSNLSRHPCKALSAQACWCYQMTSEFNLDIPTEGHDLVLQGGTASLVSNAVYPVYNISLLLCLAFGIPLLPLYRVSGQNPGNIILHVKKRDLTFYIT